MISSGGEALLGLALGQAVEEMRSKAATALLPELVFGQPAVEGLLCGLTTDEESCCGFSDRIRF
jgi:hypothetical protein